MDEVDVLDVLLALLALVYFTVGWIYRRIKAGESRRRPSEPVGNVASPISTLTRPSGLRLPPVAIPAGIGSFAAVITASLAFALWVSSQASVPANVARAAALFPLWFCIGAPLMCALSALVVTIADNSFREFQARPLPAGLPLALGVLIGLAFSLASGRVLLAVPCGVFDPC